MTVNLEELVKKYSELAKVGCIDEAEDMAGNWLEENGNDWNAAIKLNDALEAAGV
jgi:hypothetical protein